MADQRNGRWTVVKSKITVSLQIVQIKATIAPKHALKQRTERLMYLIDWWCVWRSGKMFSCTRSPLAVNDLCDSQIFVQDLGVHSVILVNIYVLKISRSHKAWENQFSLSKAKYLFLIWCSRCSDEKSEIWPLCQEILKIVTTLRFLIFSDKTF